MWVTQIFLLTDLGLEKGNNVYPVDTTLDSISHNIYFLTSNDRNFHTIYMKSQNLDNTRFQVFNKRFEILLTNVSDINFKSINLALGSWIASKFF